MLPCNQSKIHVVSQKNHIHFKKITGQNFQYLPKMKCLTYDFTLFAIASLGFQKKTKINERINKSCQIWMWHCCTQSACLTLRPHDEIRHTYLAVSKWPYLLDSWIEKIDMDMAFIYLSVICTSQMTFLLIWSSKWNVNASKRCWNT